MWKAILIWIACMAIGVIGGFFIGWVVWQMGFELLGSWIAIAGAGLGGVVVLFWYLRRMEMV